jgi:hypothetical protein
MKRQVFDGKLLRIIDGHSSVSLDYIPQTHQILALELLDILSQLILLQQSHIPGSNWFLLPFGRLLLSGVFFL